LIIRSSIVVTGAHPRVGCANNVCTRALAML
jgi:hypothetical protein